MATGELQEPPNSLRLDVYIRPDLSLMVAGTSRSTQIIRSDMYLRPKLGCRAADTSKSAQNIRPDV